MSDRTINFGESESEATYQIQDTHSTGGGNFVVAKDTNANTVLLQYDPATDTWEYAADVDMNGGNVSGVGSLTAESVNTEQAGRGNGNLWEENSIWNTSSFSTVTSPSDVSSTEFVEIADMIGFHSPAQIPDGASLYGEFFVRRGSVDTDESVTYRPVVLQEELEENATSEPMTELEIELDEDNSGEFSLESTGVTEITSFPTVDFISASALEAKVSGGTASPQGETSYNLSLFWRVD